MYNTLFMGMEMGLCKVGSVQVILQYTKCFRILNCGCGGIIIIATTLKLAHISPYLNFICMVDSGVITTMTTRRWGTWGRASGRSRHLPRLHCLCPFLLSLDALQLWHASGPGSWTGEGRWAKVWPQCQLGGVFTLPVCFWKNYIFFSLINLQQYQNSHLDHPLSTFMLLPLHWLKGHNPSKKCPQAL